MKTLDSLHAMARELDINISKKPAIEVRALHAIGMTIKHDSKSMFGIYQKRSGPFSRWPQLAKRTKKERKKLGYKANEPLLREGDLRDSIDFTLRAMESAVIVGSTSPIMIYHEYGTIKMPARSVLRRSVFRSKLVIQEIARMAGFAMITDSSLAKRSLYSIAKNPKSWLNESHAN